MAEIKKEAPKDDRHWFIAFFPIIALLFIIILGSRMSGETIFGEKIQNAENDPIASKRDVFSIYEWIGGGPLGEGIRIINTKELPVRNQPAGAIIGTQKKLETGVLREGPVLMYDIVWWGVDYKDAPDGWVPQQSISSKIKTVRFFNIIPITYGFYKPIGYILLILLFVTFLVYKFRLTNEEEIWRKKLELKKEQYKEKEISIAQRIEQKPDVEEIPGFQTEEIMPVELLEQQGRWQHIQDLIKSYNMNDWRQAIIEADIILEEMLEKMGYDGVTIGDKLKNIERSDFVTLDKAWSAHKIRNQIAHDGSNFKLTREVAEKTIKDFEDVFKEFYYI